MATKIKSLKLLQEMRAFADLERAIRPPRPPSLFLMHLHSHLSEKNQPKRRLIVTTDLEDSLDMPHPVRITHLKPRSSA